MTEKIIQYVWQHRLFYPTGMIAMPTGEHIEVINPGQLNTDAGPDFFNAQIRIGQTLWAGNVEIHQKTNDWYQHGHHTDSAYNNVILHVVAETSNEPILTESGRQVPEIVLLFPTDIIKRFDAIDKSTNVIRCGQMLSQLSAFDRDSWIDRMLTERFEQRQQMVETLIAETNCDWDQIFFILLCRTMGFVVNAEPMQMLAQLTPVKIMFKHNSIMQQEALLFGQAGLLPTEPTDEYSHQLIREYEFLKNKFNLTSLNNSQWKWLRLRPSNFPTIRIAQLATIINRIQGNFESIFATTNIAQLIELLTVRASDYWTAHYAFGKNSKIAEKKLGLQSQRLIIINTIIPLLFAYARRQSNEKKQLNVMKMLSFLPIEKNSVISDWKQCGIVPQHEGEAQALLLLYKEYCKKHKCLICRWGHAILAGH